MPFRKITAILSAPRIGFLDNIFVATNAFFPMGISVAKHNGPYWERSLSHLLYQQIPKNDYVIVFDYDSVFTRWQVEELLRLTENSGADAVFATQLQRNSVKIMKTAHPQAGASDGELSRALTGHFGLTVLRCASFEKIPHPWFWSVPNDEGKWEEGTRRVDADNGFWIAADRYGWKFYQADRVRIGHIEQMVTWVLPDGTIIQQNIEDFENSGVPEGIPTESLCLEQGASRSLVPAGGPLEALPCASQ